MALDQAQPYLLPRRLLAGAEAVQAIAAGEALALAGGPLAFTHVAILRRGPDGTARGLLFPCTAPPRAAAIPPEQWDRWLERVGRPRPAFAGLDLAEPRLMGILNVTPDSFSDGGRYADPDAAVAHGLALVEAGADILDIGGESTRPGAAPVSLEAERARVLPVLEALAGRIAAPVSLDTRKAALMREGVRAGAAIVNDVSALRADPEALAAVSESGACAVLMHMQGEPATMQRDPRYRDVLLDVYDHLAERISACEAAGIPRNKLAVDPGIGFGKDLGHNLRLMGNLALFHGLGCPVLIGVSRKAFIGRIAGAESGGRLLGSVAAAIAGLAQGVQLFRVHDMAETRQAFAVWRALHAC